ncbi:MAG: hypothetical protein IJO08_01390 [Clostridia bacterium]|nr:hypothetical protein [Clostridia bacterium]
MKRPKDELSKQEFSTLVVIICAILGCACMLIVVFTQDSHAFGERLLSSVFFGGIGVFFLAMLFWYIAYLRAKRKYGIGRDHDRNKWDYWGIESNDVDAEESEKDELPEEEQKSDENLDK